MVPFLCSSCKKGGGVIWTNYLLWDSCLCWRKQVDISHEQRDGFIAKELACELIKPPWGKSIIGPKWIFKKKIIGALDDSASNETPHQSLMVELIVIFLFEKRLWW